jgi:WD40 repeat protein/serine/threonine protein kinase
MDPHDSDLDLVEQLAEEFARRRRGGERPAVTEYVQRYPELAELIRKTFPVFTVPEAPPAQASPLPASEGEEVESDRFPRQLGEYRIVREVGRGGMGVVYEAVQESLGRHVALKVLPGYGPVHTVHLERFRREARAAARLHHTNIVPVFGVGDHQGIYFYAMQFIDGRGLDALLREMRDLRAQPTQPQSTVVERTKGKTDAPARETAAFQVGPPPAGDAESDKETPRASAETTGLSELATATDQQYYRGVARIGVQAAEALAYAHGQGILHRDIKPSNLMLDAHGTVWITDFGLAKEASAGEASPGDLTATGDLIGTPRYMAPERLQGTSGPAGDIYGLGLTLYELLTLTPAFAETNRARLMEQIAHQEPVPPRKLDPRIPRDLETIVLKAAAKEVDRRYASAAELADDLRRYLAEEPILARRVGTSERMVKWARRHPAVACLLTLLLVLGAVAFGLVTWEWREAEQMRAAAESSREEAQELAEAEKKAAAEADKQTQAAQQARARMANALGEAETQTRVARKARAEMADALNASEVNLYFHRIALAQREWLANHVARAETILDECPKALRQWEWHYLKRLCHAGLMTLPLTDYGNCAIFSPDGKRVAAGDESGNVSVWNATTGKRLFAVREHSRIVRRVAYNADGNLLASAGYDGLIKVQEAATGKELFALGVNKQLIHDLAFSRDGKWLASVGEDKAVHLFDVDARREKRRLVGHTELLSCVAFSPDGKRIASAGWDKTVRVWDRETGATLLTFVDHENSVECLAFSPDGKRIASAGRDKAVFIWNAATGKDLHRFWGHTETIHALAFSPDGKRLASAGVDQTIRVWDAATGQELLTLRGHQDVVRGIAFDKDGKRLVSASGDKTVHIWDATTPLEARTLTGHTMTIWGVAFSPDSRRVASASWDKTVRICDADTGEHVMTLGRHGHTVHGVAYSPNGQQIATASWDKTVKLWDANTGAEVNTLTGHKQAVFTVAWSPDNKRLASAGAGMTIRLWDVASAKAVLLKGHKGPVFRVAFSPDGKQLASAAGGDEVRIWDTTTGQQVASLPGSRQCLAFSPDGELLATSNVKGDAIIVWHMATATELATLRGHTDAILCLAFHKDGKRLASSSRDKTIKLWDLGTGREVLTLQGHTEVVHAIAFSPDGQRLVSVGVDKTVRIWDATAYEPTKHQE